MISSCFTRRLLTLSPSETEYADCVPRLAPMAKSPINRSSTDGRFLYPHFWETFPLALSLALCQHVDMVCIYCGSETSVENSRLQKRSNQVWRRRQCKACRAIFTTHEAIDLSSTLLVRNNGSCVPFIADLLFTDILLALQDRKDCYIAARETTHTAVGNLLKLPNSPLFETKQISEASAKVLKRLDKRAYLRFVSEHPSLQ